MRKFIGKSNERIICKLSKSEMLRLYSIVYVAMETTKTSHFDYQSKSFISIFSLPKFQLVSCNLSLAIIWQMSYTHKLPKLCSATSPKMRVWRPKSNLKQLYFCISLKSESWNDSRNFQVTWKPSYDRLSWLAISWVSRTTKHVNQS